MIAFVAQDTCLFGRTVARRPEHGDGSGAGWAEHELVGRGVLLGEAAGRVAEDYGWAVEGVREALRSIHDGLAE
ncbi:hypothetical protein ACFY7A_05075 [Streptomyces longwoodensis]|uniref:hypothetical protein n=1 Tax=Streptomyces longwoodensis TaxID=68231 RepID=UPI0036A8066E